MFTFKDKDEKQEFILWVSGNSDKIRGYSSGQSLALLLNKTTMYESTYMEYIELLRIDPAVFHCLKLDYYINVEYFDSKCITNSLKAVHMLEIPLCDIPLYMNSLDRYASRISEWRLEIGR